MTCSWSYYQAPQLSKKEIEDLLKKGAYGAIMDEDDDANKWATDYTCIHSNSDEIENTTNTKYTFFKGFVRKI